MLGRWGALLEEIGVVGGSGVARLIVGLIDGCELLDGFQFSFSLRIRDFVILDSCREYSCL